MSSLAEMSDAELMARYNAAKKAQEPPAKVDITKLSDAELSDLYAKKKAESAPEDNSLLGKAKAEATALLASPYGVHIPIIGDIGQAAGNAAIAAYKAIKEDKPFGETYSALQADVRKFREKEDKQAPIASTIKGIAGGLAVPIPGAGMGGIGGAAARILGGAATTGASELIQGRSADEAKSKAESTGALAAGIEAAIPIGAAAATAVAPAVKKGMSIVFGAPLEAVKEYLKNPEAIRAAQTIEHLKEQLDNAVETGKASIESAASQHANAKEALKSAQTVVEKGFDWGRQKLVDAVQDAKQAFGLAKGDYKANVRAASVPGNVADEIVTMLGAESHVLGSLSEQADDALVRANVSASKEDLIEAFNVAGRKIGVEQKGGRRVLISAEDEKAVAKLMDLKQRVASLDPVVAGPALRDVMQGIRKEINWNVAAGEVNTTLNSALKTVQGQISSVLKEQPSSALKTAQGSLKGPPSEYAAYMTRMKTLSDSLESMSKFFGTREKALSSLETLAGSDKAKSQIINESLTKYLEATKGAKGAAESPIMQQIMGLKEAKSVLAMPSKFEAAAQQLPEAGQLSAAQQKLGQFVEVRPAAEAAAVQATPEFAAAQAAKGTLDKAIASMEPFGNLKPTTTEAFLKRVQSGKNAIEVTKQLDAISEATGINFPEALKNRKFADAFEKGYMNGSRNVNLWTIIGALFGGKAAGGGQQLGVNFSQLPALSGAGAAVGATIDKMGPKMAQKSLDAYMALRDSKYADVLLQAAKRGNAAVAAVHADLFNGDKTYRRIFETSMQKRANEGDK